MNAQTYSNNGYINIAVDLEHPEQIGVLLADKECRLVRKDVLPPFTLGREARHIDSKCLILSKESILHEVSASNLQAASGVTSAEALSHLLLVLVLINKESMEGSRVVYLFEDDLHQMASLLDMDQNQIACAYLCDTNSPTKMHIDQDTVLVLDRARQSIYSVQAKHGRLQVYKTRPNFFLDKEYKATVQYEVSEGAGKSTVEGLTAQRTQEFGGN